MTRKPAETENLPTYKKTMLQAVAYKRVRSLVNGVVAHFELNTTQWIILGVLYESATGLRITDIARSLEVEVPLITRLSQALLRAGLVKESKPAGSDRRAKPLALTAHGKVLVSRIERELNGRMDKLEGGLSEREASNYFQTLETLTDNAKN